MRHVPVLLHEVIASLQLRSNMNVVDCTLGDGGHAEEILKQTSPNGKLLGIDADPESLVRAKKFLYGFGKRVVYVRNNFEHLDDIVKQEQFRPVSAVLMDLGWSSPQMEERGRGLSFERDEPLDMRYGANFQFSIFNFQNPSAADLVNRLKYEELEQIFREYGEEDLSFEIANVLVDRRRDKKIETTKQLVEIILDVYRKKLKSTKDVPWVGGLHPATKVFQALRIAVNDELGVIERALPKAISVLETGGRLAVITFHSLEDRIVKHYFKDQEGKTINIITNKPIASSDEECEKNSRACSAKLRVVEKI